MKLKVNIQAILKEIKLHFRENKFHSDNYEDLNGGDPKRICLLQLAESVWGRVG
ncbi:hypothetical protein JOD24_002161 [Kroppenstedtia sanguinis]|uniref:Uncharacterized protein n=1 Tax=Kroppenstedtia sanguinis TaxID=1380684 RepID=A0ABW4C8H5_9BACL